MFNGKQERSNGNITGKKRRRNVIKYKIKSLIFGENCSTSDRKELEEGN